MIIKILERTRSVAVRSRTHLGARRRTCGRSRKRSNKGNKVGNKTRSPHAAPLRTKPLPPPPKNALPPFARRNHRRTSRNVLVMIARVGLPCPCPVALAPLSLPVLCH